MRRLLILLAGSCLSLECADDPFSVPYWNPTGVGDWQSEETYGFNEQLVPMSEVENYEFHRKCDNDIDRCEVQRVIFPSKANIEELKEIFDIRVRMIQPSGNYDERQEMSFSNWFGVGDFIQNEDFEGIPEEDIEGTPGPRYHVWLKQVVQNDPDSKLYEFMATSQRFSIDFDATCTTDSKISYSYRKSNPTDTFVDDFLSSSSEGFLFANFYSNMYNPIFDKQPYETEFTECPQIDVNTLSYSGCSTSIPSFSSICHLSIEQPHVSDIQLVLIDQNIKNNTNLNCEGTGDLSCTVLGSMSLMEGNEHYSLVSDQDFKTQYYIADQLQFNQPFDFEEDFFYNVGLVGKNIGPWDGNSTFERDVIASARITIIDAPDTPPTFSKIELLLRVFEGRKGNLVMVQGDTDEVFQVESYDPDMQLKWKTKHYISEVNDDECWPLTETNCLLVAQETDCPEASSRCNAKIETAEIYYSECDPESDNECLYDSQPTRQMTTRIATVEIVPETWLVDHPSCTNTAEHCFGLPKCGWEQQGMYYQNSTSSLIRVNIEDINNNPPRFFNSNDRKWIDGSIDEGILSCPSCGTDFGVIEEGTLDVAVFTDLNLSLKEKELIIIYDMDDTFNAQFNVTISAIIYRKGNNDVNPCVECGICTSPFSLSQTDFIQQWTNVVIQFKNIIIFECADEIKLTLTAQDSKEVTCKGDASNCNARSLTAKLTISERNKLPQCASDLDEPSLNCGDMTLEGTIQEYTANDVNLGADKLIFRTSNTEQYRQLYFCKITEGGASSTSEDFQVRFNGVESSNYTTVISEEFELELDILKRDEAVVDITISYVLDIYVCSGEKDLNQSELALCCSEPTQSQARVKVNVEDDNINAPNFDFYVGPDQVQVIPDGALQEDEKSGKLILKTNIRDSDNTISNTRTCFNIINMPGRQCADPSDELDANEYFIVEAEQLTNNINVWKAEVKLKKELENIIKNCNDQSLDGQHYNFYFMLQACNYVGDTNAATCPEDMDTHFCSDTKLQDNSQLIGSEGQGNSHIQIPVRDINLHTPVFSDDYENEACYSVYEHIENELEVLNNIEVKASDNDRCWYGNGLITFSNENELNKYFTTSGGHSLTYLNRNDCPRYVTAEILLGDDTIYREQLPLGTYYDGLNYKLTVRARDNPQSGSTARQDTTNVTIEIKDINNYYPAFTINDQELLPPSDYQQFGKSFSIYEGSVEKSIASDLKFYICEAFDPDSNEYSTDINEYEMRNVTGCKDSQCNELIEEDLFGHFTVSSKATIAPPSIGYDNAPCDQMVELVVSRTDHNNAILLDREEVPFYKIVVGVKDTKCSDDLLASQVTCGDAPFPRGCTCSALPQTKCKDLLHKCEEEYSEKVIYVAVEDINDKGPVFEPSSNKVSYIVKAAADSNTKVGETFLITDDDLTANHTHMEVRLISHQYEGCPQTCPDEDYFQVSNALNVDGAASFAISTAMKIPSYDATNFFTSVKIEIEAYNPRAKYAYPCDSSSGSLSQKYSNMKCYDVGDNNDCGGDCAGHIYNTKIVTVTVIDDDHSGDVKSTNTDWSDELSKFEADMDGILENYYHGKENEKDQFFPDFIGYSFDTRVYEVLPFYESDTNSTEDGQPNIQKGNVVSFFVSCEPLQKDVKITFLMDQKSMEDALVDINAASILKQYDVVCVMGCRDDLPDDKTITVDQLIVIIVALGATLIALVIIFSCVIHYLKKKYHNKMDAIKAFHDTTEGYDGHELTDRADFNKEAYNIANGEVNRNKLHEREGEINLGINYDEKELDQSEATEESMSTYQSDDDEPKEVFVDPITRDTSQALSSFLISGGGPGQKTNPLAGMNENDFENF